MPSAHTREQLCTYLYSHYLADNVIDYMLDHDKILREQIKQLEAELDGYKLGARGFP